MGLQPKIQDVDGQSKLPNVRILTQRMVYDNVVTAHPDSFDATKYHIPNRGSGIGYEVGILINRRNWCMNDANPVATSQPYTTNSIY